MDGMSILGSTFDEHEGLEQPVGNGWDLDDFEDGTHGA